MTALTIDTRTAQTERAHDRRRVAALTRLRTAVRAWFARSQLGPVDNYVTR